jgi:hypothetical protein
MTLQCQYLKKPMLKKPMFLHAGLLALGLASGCSQQDHRSSLRYAHLPANRMAGTPLGQLEIIKNGIAHQFGDRLKVCLQSSGDRTADASRLLETRLAHVAWLASAGYGSTDYNRLSFEIRDQCSTSDASAMTVVIFGDKAKEKPGDQFDKLFSPARMSCTSSAESISCRSDGGITLGWGGPATLRSFYRTDAPQTWTKVERTAPATVILSPHVAWKPLTDGLQTASGSGSQEQQSIVRLYQTLQAQSSPGFEDLKSLAESLATANAKGAEDQEFQRIMQQFAQNRGAAGPDLSGYEYRPVVSSYHTLLHEVGHTFGMSHADNPDADVITGPSATTTCDASGRCTTKESAMAYGDAFNFLTADDLAGIQAAAKAVQNDISSHR